MLFLGDSFTWGEGLELYMNKEPFISMRNQKATDIELRDISDYKDTEVEEWRSSKRFSNYVDGFEKYVQDFVFPTYFFITLIFYNQKWMKKIIPH